VDRKGVKKEVLVATSERSKEEGLLSRPFRETSSEPILKVKGA